MVPSGEGPDKFASDEVEKGLPPNNEIHITEHADGSSGILTSENQAASAVSPEKSQRDHTVGKHISQLDKEGSISSITPHKVTQTADTSSTAPRFGQEGRTPIIREKVLEDGFHWRKYGQKFVKGNEFIRSYYKCTHPSCQVKKQLERSHDGQIADVVYFGQHDHPKPELNIPLAVGFVLSVVDEKAEKPLSSGTEDNRASHVLKSKTTSQITVATSNEEAKGVLSESNKLRDEVDIDDEPHSKRQKKGSRGVEPASADKPSADSRIVVQTLSEVDIVNDGFRWRKYGQKLVKGNPNPRSYYRCSSPGCPVKKHVERASHDPKVVITSYEGQHDHDMPPSRTVTHNTTALDSYTTPIHNSERAGKSRESHWVVHNSSGPSANSNEQPSSESRTKPKGSSGSGFDKVTHTGSGQVSNKSNKIGVDAGRLDKVTHSSSGQASKSNKLQNGKSSAGKGTDPVVTDAVEEMSLAPEHKSSEKQDGESRTESKVNCSAYSINPGPENNPNEQHIPNAEPVQS